MSTESEDAGHTYEGLIRSFEYFGSATQEVLVDNQKSAVVPHAGICAGPSGNWLSYRNAGEPYPVNAGRRVRREAVGKVLCGNSLAVYSTLKPPAMFSIVLPVTLWDNISFIAHSQGRFRAGDLQRLAHKFGQYQNFEVLHDNTQQNSGLFQ